MRRHVSNSAHPPYHLCFSNLITLSHTNTGPTCWISMHSLLCAPSTVQNHTAQASLHRQQCTKLPHSQLSTGQPHTDPFASTLRSSHSLVQSQTIVFLPLQNFFFSDFNYHTTLEGCWRLQPKILEHIPTWEPINEFQSIQTSYGFIDKDYLSQSQLIRTPFKSKDKLNHLMSTEPKSGDSTFAA